MNKQSRRWRLYFWPVLLAALTASGLTFALVADGFWDFVSWVSLGIPLIVMLSFFRGGKAS